MTLILLGAFFVFPFVWLVSSSLQPREQIMRMPPKWLPSMYYTAIDNERVRVTPPDTVAVASVIVILSEGPDTGQTRLVPQTYFKDGRLRIITQEAHGTKERWLSDELQKKIPAGWVQVQEWFLGKYETRTPRRICVPPDAVEEVFEPVWENYPEALRQLTPGEADRKERWLTILGRTRYAWTSPKDTTRHVTFLTYLSNTLIVALLGVIGTVLSSSLVAYGLARIQWRGRGILLILTISTMMIPFPVVMIPLYSVFRYLGWIGTLKPLWVPAFFGGAFNIFLLRQFFMTIPKELSDAARIDGCSELGIYWRIVMPLSKPALAVVGLFHFLFAWNDFLGPLLFLTRPETYTLSLGLQQYQSQHGGSEWHLLMAVSTLLILPIVGLFFITQKTFIQGISTTGMKG